MCLALYLAAEKPLPVIAWRAEAPAFHVVELPAAREAVRAQFSLPFVYQAGSRERCGCLFNYGREYPQHEVNPLQLAAARECVAQLSAYVREHGVLRLYACQFGDEQTRRERQRAVTPDELGSDGFVFHERELIEIDQNTSHPPAAGPVATRRKLGRGWLSLNKPPRG